MSPQRSSRRQKTPKGFLSSDEQEDIHRKVRAKRRRTVMRKTEDLDGMVEDDGCQNDILNIIDSTHETKRGAEEWGDVLVEIVDKGVDEDCVSVSSIASGPSVLCKASPKKHKPMQDLCSTCRILFQRVKKLKKPMKDKLLDNNPKSLTCDQWVLVKTWIPRRLPNREGNLSTHIQMIKRRLQVKKGANVVDLCLGEKESTACSRPRIFLQRNLRQCASVPMKKEKKKSKRKRKSDGSQGPPITKKQRLRRNHQPIIDSSPDANGLRPASRNSSDHGNEDCSDGEMDDVTIELVPSTVTLETAKPEEPMQNERKGRGGFRELLAQLRGNSSMIVRETR